VRETTLAIRRGGPRSIVGLRDSATTSFLHGCESSVLIRVSKEFTFAVGLGRGCAGSDNAA